MTANPHTTVSLNAAGFATAIGKLQPHREDEVVTWLRKQRDEQHAAAKESPGRARVAYSTIDDLIDEYRLRADLGLALEAEIPGEANR
jgi:hypothetical protein